MKNIRYQDGYKYQLKDDYVIVLADIVPDAPIATEFLEMDLKGTLTIKEGYAWDGPSGPTVDTLNFMRGSLVHDALYQLMREKHLNEDVCRPKADRHLQRLCIEDGMSSWRAWYVYQGVRFFGKSAAEVNKKSTCAPRPCID